ncbi:2OG-Fe(II) oxygenase, partial [archaeon]
MSVLSEQDRLHLCLSGFPVVIKEDGFSDISEQVQEEARRFYTEHPECFQRALVGTGKNTRLAAERGDKRCWLTPSVCQEYNLTALSALVKRVMGWCKELKQPLQLNGDFSVQLACYPGGGTRYIRHKDASTDVTQSTDHSAPKLAGQRKLTWLCYLNQQCEGGNLRVFHPLGHLDILPSLGKVVVMRSDEVEHEVLACHTPRMAITVWAYA